MELEGLTGKIIGAAITVHRSLGPGFLESVYENALALELEAQGVPFERQHTVTVVYRGVPVGQHRLDLLVDRQVVVELKALKALLPEHHAVVRAQLRAANLNHGLLLNFHAPTLEIRRVIHTPITSGFLLS